MVGEGLPEESRLEREGYEGWDRRGEREECLSRAWILERGFSLGPTWGKPSLKDMWEVRGRGWSRGGASGRRGVAS